MLTRYININGEYKALMFKYEERIRATEKIRIDINKETDINKMLELALLYISLDIQDFVFYEQNIKKMKM